MKIKTLLTLTFAIALGCNIANSVSAAIINIIPSKDNTLYEYDPAEGDHSNGAGFHFFAGENGMGELRRGVLAFDLAGTIPAGSTITAVSHHEHVYDACWCKNRRAAQAACRLGRRNLPRAHGGR